MIPAKVKTDFSSLLNEAQCEAVTAPDGPILVLAAAGTGKTRTLTYRVAYLMEQGIAPQEILLLTFTNRAAKEMLERAEALVGPAINSLWSGTFHHVCNRILRAHAPKVGFPQSFTILDRDAALSLINKHLKALVADPKAFIKKEVVAAFIGKMANTQRDFTECFEEADFRETINPDELRAVVHRYEEAKRDMGAMDFDDLLVLTLRLFREHPEVLRRYAERFRYVLVDEYQDTNIIQSQLVDALASVHRNIMAVGDDFQCIYSWRGADFRNIMEFPKRWEECRIIKLEQNYRSTPEILAVANACIAGNPQQFKKTLRATIGSGEKPLLAYLHDGHEQANLIIRAIQHALAQGYNERDIAVLYRSHFHAMELEMALKRQRIDYVITSGVGIFDSAHIKDVIAFLRMCSGSADLFAFTRVMGLLPGVGEKTADKIWVKLTGQFTPSRETDRLQLKALLPAKARAAWEPLDNLIACYQTDDLENNGNKATTRFLEMWYGDYLRKQYDNAEERMEDVAEFASQFKRGESVSAFLNDVALMTNIDAESAAITKDRPAIHLSTVHQAKGLEWPVVIMLWCMEEMFPSAKAIKESGDAEERRLFYVAVTRAKDNLMLCLPSMRRMPNGGTFYLKPSRFVKELPPALTSRIYGAR